MLALVRDGDIITIDARQNLLAVDVPDDELARRKAAWTPVSKITNPRGVLAKYARLVKSAHFGATTS